MSSRKPRRVAALPAPPVSAARLLALSDGVFAIAITLLVLDLKAPSLTAGADSAGLKDAILASSDAFVGYLISFFVVGLYWIAHHRCFERVEKADGKLLRLNLLFLFFISFIPYPTKLLSSYGGNVFAIQFYALTMACAGFGLWAVQRHAFMTPSLLSGGAARPGELDHLRRLRTPVVFVLSALIAAWSTKVAIYSWYLMALLPLLESRLAKPPTH